MSNRRPCAPTISSSQAASPPRARSRAGATGSRALASATLVAVLATSTAAIAWSSKDFPLFEPVHQLAIDNVLKDVVSADDLKLLEQEQVEVDKDQREEHSFEHAMTGVLEDQEMGPQAKPYEEQRRKSFIAQTEQLVGDRIREALAARNAGDETAAMKAVGRAIHALEDATSPAHERFQIWSDRESAFFVADHLAHERLYPRDGGPNGYRTRLEAAVRWTYDMYLAKTPVPEHLFDASGYLLIPARYLTPTP
jgi:hypothetical protein